MKVARLSFRKVKTPVDEDKQNDDEPTTRSTRIKRRRKVEDQDEDDDDEDMSMPDARPDSEWEDVIDRAPAEDQGGGFVPEDDGVRHDRVGGGFLAENALGDEDRGGGGFIPEAVHMEDVNIEGGGGGEIVPEDANIENEDSGPDGLLTEGDARKLAQALLDGKEGPTQDKDVKAGVFHEEGTADVKPSQPDVDVAEHPARIGRDTGDKHEGMNTKMDQADRGFGQFAENHAGPEFPATRDHADPPQLPTTDASGTATMIGQPPGSVSDHVGTMNAGDDDKEEEDENDRGSMISHDPEDEDAEPDWLESD